MGGMRIRGSFVYSMDTDDEAAPIQEDTAAFSVGGIVNFGQFAVGANYTDNGDVGAVGSGDSSSYFNVAASFSQGPIGLAVGYLDSTYEGAGGDDTYTHIALTADYSLAPGLGVYADIASISSETAAGATNDGTGIILGANVSF